MKLDLHYTDPRLVALYDLNNPRGNDTDFYVQLAAEIKAKNIIDLGCGTGLLTRELVDIDRHITGIDPSPAMLEFAMQQPDANRVQWKKGDATDLGSENTDLVLMTGNVAQIFVEDSNWYKTIRAIHKTLRQDGYLAFESRYPAAKAWENWNRESTYKLIRSPYGPIECWLELIRESNSLVFFKSFFVFTETGEVFVAESELRFRSLEETTDTLKSVGFCIQNVYGSWQREPVTNKSKVMVFIAQNC